MLDPKITVLISANVEWQVIRRLFPDAAMTPSHYGEFISAELGGRSYRFFHGGWGKIAAAGSTQYVIDRWQPRLLINLGTCGGFAGRIERGAVVLVEKTIVYDIIEQMGDFDDHIAHYSTELDLDWLLPPHPLPVQRGLLVSADRDLVVDEIPELMQRYGAAAGDWESGAIAWIARRNRIPLLILRGVTDLVGSTGGEAYGDLDFFRRAAEGVMRRLVDSLPEWRFNLPLD